ncbi:MAG: segregation/condensation protein A [Deltaproteobacteria bacterium]|nr:segregation/condensation protein A [Deltaproteobacteria bacterium]
MNLEDLESAESCRIRLPVFEGPLDLLLHLIKKEDLDIQEIPISLILTQYLEYLRLAEDLDVDLAGEFLDMAAELAYIKSKMLLPDSETEEDEGNDPRAGLVQKLLEYQKFKRAAMTLLQRPILGKNVFKRAPSETGAEITGEEEVIEADTLSLLTAFQELLKRMPKGKSHEVFRERVGVSERVLELIEKIRGTDRSLFDALFQEDRSRTELVVTFLALLEMARQKLIRIVQDGVGAAIVVCSLIKEGESEPS